MTTDNLRKETDQETGRDNSGRFTSNGNVGRPRGTKNKVSVAAVATIRSLTDDAFRGLAENVRANDQRAIQYVLDRVLPAGRVVELEGATTGAVSDALVSGMITPDEAKAITASLAKLQELQDMEALKDRLGQIERLLRDGS
ncbi:hypothetical protein SAMN04488020_10386 [Palleronia marisminoris]|uniref:Uncharacterized protein n=1 Tax=Palleronia marisminoris TaxID=315423 RepID=A0A1Y5S8I1_9RHOB|nr:hypothetical protein [Palleronia marisminoris]SFG64805.1 hypothetical protein SAMN04488020_10386 [Palleronia marisminoris]SLN33528.1 hypothetical protein PAM7066_01367 [Palleronia marisminoris]